MNWKNILNVALISVLAMTCGVIGYFLQSWINNNHKHHFDSEYSYDEVYHYNKCTSEYCLEIKNKAVHSDLNSDGICDICNYGATALVNGVNYNSIQQAIDSSQEAITITLYKDVVTGGLKTVANKDITLDLNGHTLFVTDPLVGSAGTQTSGFQFLKDSKVTIKDGYIKRVGPAKILIQNYSDLTLEDVIIDAKSDTIEQPCLYVLSNNFGNVLIKGDTQIIADEGQQAFDLWYGMYDIYNEGVYVTFDDSFVGKVEGIIEYGASRDIDGWKEKTILTIKSGDFSKAIFKASSAYATIEEANIILPQGIILSEIENTGTYKYCLEVHFSY